jgi:hypothetical protein
MGFSPTPQHKKKSKFQQPSINLYDGKSGRLFAGAPKQRKSESEGAMAKRGRCGRYYRGAKKPASIIDPSQWLGTVLITNRSPIRLDGLKLQRLSPFDDDMYSQQMQQVVAKKP